MSRSSDAHSLRLLTENRWWAKALADAAGDVGSLTPLRDLGGDLLSSRLWVLAPGVSTLKAGQAGVALLLDAMERDAPRRYSNLLEVLAGWRRATGPDDVARLFKALVPLFSSWGRGLGREATRLDEVARVLWEAGDVLPWAEACHGEHESARLEVTRACGAWHESVPDLGRYRMGVWHLAVCCVTPVRLSRLEAMRGRLDFKRLARDLTTLAVIGAWRMGQVRGGSPRPWPDPSVMEILRVSRLPEGPGEAQGPVAGWVTAPPAAVEVVAAPRPEDASRSTSSEAAASDPAPSSVAWWRGVRQWAEERRRDPGPLLELTSTLEHRPLWPRVAAELERASVSSSTTRRAHQRARFILALVIDEFVRARPHLLPALLDELLPPDDEVLSLGHCGRFQNAYTVVHEGWALTLSQRTLSGAAVPRQLNRAANIVPWDDLRGLDERARREKQDEAIDRAFRQPGAAIEDIWRGVYWAIIRARNDEIHSWGHSLRGRVRPAELRQDMLLFHGLAALRFRDALTRRSGQVELTALNITCL